MEFNPAFSKNDLYNFLIQRGVEEDEAKKLQDEKVDGETFQDITEAELKEIGLKLGSRKKILKIIENFKQSVLQNAELQDLQILGGDSNLSNSLVFDLIAASGSSCTVLPTISSTTSLAPSATKELPASSTTTEKVPATESTPSKVVIEKKFKPCSSSFLSGILPPRKKPKSDASTSSYLSELLPESTPSSSVEDRCTESATANALYTYSDPKNINVLAILDKHTTGKAIIHNLKTGKGISKTDINEIVRILVHAMIDDLRTLYPTSAQKLNMAKAIVRDLPELKSNREGVAGYEQFYDPENNAGSIEWRLKTVRVKAHASEKRYRPRTVRSQFGVRVVPQNKNNEGKGQLEENSIQPLVLIDVEEAHQKEQFYDPSNNSGSVEWRLKTLRVRVPAEKKKRRSKALAKMQNKNQEGKKEEKKDVYIDDETEQKINWLKSQRASEINKTEIFKVMEETFNFRRHYITESKPSVSDILEEFPCLKEFDGALIDADFKLMFPDAKNLLEALPEYSEKIRIYVTLKRQDIAERVGPVADANLKAMMYLADLMPIPGKRMKGESKPCHPSEMLLTCMGQENSAPSLEYLPNHPRLICCGEIQDEELQFFLVLDQDYIDLGKCFIKALDILYKSHQVFNVEYPRNLDLFYRFLDTFVYKISSGFVRSSVEHLHNIICCVNTSVI